VERLAALDPDLRKLAVLADPVGDARTGGESPASLAVETDHVAPRAHEYPTVLRAGADRESGFGNRERAAGGRLLGDDSEPAGAVAGGDREAVSVALNDDRVGTGEPRDRLVAVGVVHEGGVVGLDQDDDAPRWVRERSPRSVTRQSPANTRSRSGMSRVAPFSDLSMGGEAEPRATGSRSSDGELCV